MYVEYKCDISLANDFHLKSALRFEEKKSGKIKYVFIFLNLIHIFIK